MSDSEHRKQMIQEAWPPLVDVDELKEPLYGAIGNLIHLEAASDFWDTAAELEGAPFVIRDAIDEAMDQSVPPDHGGTFNRTAFNRAAGTMNERFSFALSVKKDDDGFLSDEDMKSRVFQEILDTTIIALTTIEGARYEGVDQSVVGLIGGFREWAPTDLTPLSNALGTATEDVRTFNEIMNNSRSLMPKIKSMGSVDEYVSEYLLEWQAFYGSVRDKASALSPVDDLTKLHPLLFREAIMSAAKIRELTAGRDEQQNTDMQTALIQLVSTLYTFEHRQGFIQNFAMENLSTRRFGRRGVSDKIQPYLQHIDQISEIIFRSQHHSAEQAVAETHLDSTLVRGMNTSVSRQNDRLTDWHDTFSKIDAVGEEALSVDTTPEQAVAWLTVDTWRAECINTLRKVGVMSLSFAGEKQGDFERWLDRPLHRQITEGDEQEQLLELEQFINQKNQELRIIDSRYHSVGSGKHLRKIDDGIGRRKGIMDALESDSLIVSHDVAGLLVGLSHDRTSMDQLLKIYSDYIAEQTIADELGYIESPATENTSLLDAISLLLELEDEGQLGSVVAPRYDKKLSEFAARLRAVADGAEEESIIETQEDELLPMNELLDDKLARELITLPRLDIEVFPPEISDTGSVDEIKSEYARIMNGARIKTPIDWKRVEGQVELRDRLRANGIDCKLMITAPTKWSGIPFFALEFNGSTSKAVILEAPVYGKATYAIFDNEWPEIAQMYRRDARDLGARKIIHSDVKQHNQRLFEIIATG